MTRVEPHPSDVANQTIWYIIQGHCAQGANQRIKYGKQAQFYILSRKAKYI